MQYQSKIQYFDLRHELAARRLPNFIGPISQLEQAQRILSLGRNNNIAITAPSGSGKSMFAMHAALSKKLESYPAVLFPAEGFVSMGTDTYAKYCFDAFETLSDGAYIFDDFGALVYNKLSMLQKMQLLLRPLIESKNTNVLLTMDQKEKQWIEQNEPSFLTGLQTIELEPFSTETQAAILMQARTKLGYKNVVVKDQAYSRIVSLVTQNPSLGVLPKAGIRLLDEALVASGESAKILSDETLAGIVSQKTGIPLSQLSSSPEKKLQNLPMILKQAIIGQDLALEFIATTVQRAQLGLKDNRRPLASFLLLGPSGVGKTETAKVLAREIFGSEKHFLRLDMSEFSEPHTVQRLLGSPPGYVGSESGGQLTNHLKSQPFSLILLDEIEKAHPRIFDIFLQLLDDGRITSGQGEVISANKCIVFATSNAGVQEILTGGDTIHAQTFLQQTMMPVLQQRFRTEFLNRFDGITIYSPLSQESLLTIAKKEIKKIEQRLAQHDIHFAIDTSILTQRINELADPMLGARPIRRFIENTCESMAVEKILYEQTGT